MPWAPPVRCRRCGKTGKSAICPACAQAFAPERERTSSGRGRGGYDAEWRRLVAEAIRLQPWCSHCLTTTDLTGDHVDPEKRTGLTLADVDVLCRPCNARKGG